MAEKFVVDGDVALKSVQIITNELEELSKDSKNLVNAFEEESKNSGLRFTQMIADKLGYCVDILKNVMGDMAQMNVAITNYMDEVDAFSEGRD